MRMQETDIITTEIIRRYTGGEEEEALRLFVEQYQTKLYAVAYRMLGNHDDAMDALQETLVQIHRSLGTFKGNSSLYTWAYRVATNVCLNFRQRRNRRQGDLPWDDVLQPVERPQENPDAMCESKFKQFLIQQAVLKLPESQRAVLVLHDLEAVPLREVADILGIQANAAKARLQRARKALRAIIERGIVVKGMEGVGVFTEYDAKQLLG